MENNYFTGESYHITQDGYQFPQYIRPLYKFYHGEAVTTSTILSPTKFLTSGKNIIKIWDLEHPGEESLLFRVKTKIDIRATKLSSDEKTLIIGGEKKYIHIWDVANSKLLCNRETEATCNALAISGDSKYLFCCYSDGNIAIWDVHNWLLIEQFLGHKGGTTCIGISADATKVWTGGLDNTVRMWDFRQGRQLQRHDFHSQIISLGYCSTGEWLAVGMKNSFIEVLHVTDPSQYRLILDKDFVFSVKSAASGKWFISLGKYNLLNAWTTPYGAPLFQKKDSFIILSCDISADDEYIMTGSADTTAIVYDIRY